MRRLLVVLLVALAACSGAPPEGQVVTADRPSTSATTTTRPKQDPGVAACRLSAERQKERLAQGADAPMPPEAERRRSWDQYQASSYGNLRGVGIALEAAWTQGNLDEQLTAAYQLVMVCALHGVEVPPA